MNLYCVFIVCYLGPTPLTTPLTPLYPPLPPVTPFPHCTAVSRGNAALKSFLTRLRIDLFQTIPQFLYFRQQVPFFGVGGIPAAIV